MRKLSPVAVRKSEEIRLLSGAIDRLLIREPCVWDLVLSLQFWGTIRGQQVLVTNWMLTQLTGTWCWHQPANFTMRNMTPLVFCFVCVFLFTCVLWSVNSVPLKNSKWQVSYNSVLKNMQSETQRAKFLKNTSSKLWQGLTNHSCTIAKSISFVANCWWNNIEIENESPHCSCQLQSSW